MGYRKGICYTCSGDKKMYEPDLFKAQLDVYISEYCYRHDSANSYTLVFENDDRQDGFHAYLPYNGISINHSIQDNGEDHYNLVGTDELKTYEDKWPKNWSPPAGVDGPFYSTVDLKYPYYQYKYSFGDYISTWYNNKQTWIYNSILLGESSLYYGKRDW